MGDLTKDPIYGFDGEMTAAQRASVMHVVDMCKPVFTDYDRIDQSGYRNTEEEFPSEEDILVGACVALSFLWVKYERLLNEITMHEQANRTSTVVTIQWQEQACRSDNLLKRTYEALEDAVQGKVPRMPRQIEADYLKYLEERRTPLTQDQYVRQVTQTTVNDWLQSNRGRKG